MTLELENCRACDSLRLNLVLDMGDLPLAGDFRPRGEINQLYPLSILVCEECGLLQVSQAVEPDVLFNPEYSYSSSTVPGLVRHFQQYAAAKTLTQDQRPKRLLEIGCNDGVFLEPLRHAGYDVVGMDASDNVAEMARRKGLHVHTGLFNARNAEELLREHGSFDIITCSNVFAHNPDVNEFLAGVTNILEPRCGEFWVEVHSAHELYNGLQWDCFYHEHCFYWTIHALRACLRRHGFRLTQYQTTSMHGGALRAVFSQGGEELILEEEELTPVHWQNFGSSCRRSRDLIADAVSLLPIRYAYGAAGRAVTLINWSGIADQLEWVVDGSPLRYDRNIPGTNVSVISEEAFFAGLPPDWCFVTAHNYLDGIRQKVESGFPDRFIRFVTPLPHVEIR